MGRWGGRLLLVSHPANIPCSSVHMILAGLTTPWGCDERRIFLAVSPRIPRWLTAGWFAGQVQVDYSRITVLVAFCARGISSHHVHSVKPPSSSDAPALPPPRRCITLDAVSRSAHRGCHYDYPKQPCLSRTFVDFMQIIFPTALARLPAYAAARIICCCSLSARELLPLMLPSTPF